MHIREAQFPSDQKAVVAIIREYAAWLDIDMGFQNFDEEMAHIDSKYRLPSGSLWVVQNGENLVGCIGFRHLDDGAAEIKRLYVQPAFRGQQLGGKLLRTVIDTTRRLGYQRLVLDTVPQTAASHGLYQRFGFQQIAPYYNGPTLATHFFGLSLLPSR